MGDDVLCVREMARSAATRRETRGGAFAAVSVDSLQGALTGCTSTVPALSTRATQILSLALAIVAFAGKPTKSKRKNVLRTPPVPTFRT
jgi:hypothetical protein